MTCPEKPPPNDGDGMLVPFLVLLFLTVAGAVVSYLVLSLQLTRWGL